jgi:RHS repeat-associated protein
MAELTLLCAYTYDPLDRLASRHPLAEAIAQCFYKGTQLATERQGGEQRSYLRAGDYLLAQISEVGNLRNPALTATDQQSSVLNAITRDPRRFIAYTAYGHRPNTTAPPGLPGFNGEQPDPVTGHYLLGNYRHYNPVLMRFNRPDSLSPFGEGGLNAYAYGVGDPVNPRDPTGHAPERREILGYIWVGLGFVGALWGLKVAVPAVKAVLKGSAPLSQKLAAAAAVGQVAASTTLIASRVTAAVDPQSPAAEGLLWGALALGIPSFASRVASYYVAAAAKKAPILPAVTSASTPPEAVTRPTDIGRSSLSIRRNSDLYETTV